MNLVVEKDSTLEADVAQVAACAQERRPLVLTTSGTTGVPKRVECDLALALERKRAGTSTEKWLLTYSPQRWAGVSVILHVIKSAATLVVPRTLDFSAIIHAALANSVTHLSLTPSMLRNLLMHDERQELAQVPVAQLTFGGEAATQSVLDLAARTWPNARVSHVYASTEFGDICAVSDGLEGVPCEKFSAFSFSAEGELIVSGRATGDFWERRGERYLFLGRKEEIINVGGNKVSPHVVEEFAVRCGARFAKAYAVPSGLMGSVVGLDYVGDIDRLELMKSFRKDLPKYMCPALVQQVAEITLSAAGKIRRLA